MTITNDIADSVHAELIDGKWRVPRQEVETKSFIGEVVLCTITDKIPPPINVRFNATLESVRRVGGMWVATYDVEELMQ